jgi:hypothetical protein
LKRCNLNKALSINAGQVPWLEVSLITSNMRNKLCMFVVRYQFRASLLALPLNFSEPSIRSQNSEFSLLPLNNIFVIIGYGLLDPLLQ